MYRYTKCHEYICISIRHQSKYIEHVHLNFLRKLLCVNKSNLITNLSGLYGELGRVPLIIIRIVHMFRYWLKLLKLNEQSPVKQMYLLLKNDTNRNLSYNRLNWAFQIKDMLDQLGFSELWINQDNIRLNTIKQNF